MKELLCEEFLGVKRAWACMDRAETPGELLVDVLFRCSIDAGSEIWVLRDPISYTVPA
ncbi:MAG: hypothetical protein QW392_06310 [Candidatus Jordarchaeales archaeon]